MFAIQARRPKFESHNPCKKLGVAVHSCNPIAGTGRKQEDPWDWGLSRLAKLVNSMFPKRHHLKNKVEAWKDGSVVNNVCYFSEGEPEFRSQHSRQLTTANDSNSRSLHWHMWHTFLDTHT